MKASTSELPSRTLLKKRSHPQLVSSLAGGDFSNRSWVDNQGKPTSEG